MKKFLSFILLFFYIFFINTSFCHAIDYKPTQNTSSDILTGQIIKITEGTEFEVYLQTTVNTATAQKGNKIIAIVSQDWVDNGFLIAPQGSKVIGEVSKAKPAGFAYRNGYVQFDFNNIETPEGKTYKITTEKIDFQVDSEGKFLDATQKVFIGVIIGAIGGLVIGILSDNKSTAKTTAIAAAAGATTGLVRAGFEKGTDAEIPIYTQMILQLKKPLKIMITN